MNHGNNTKNMFPQFNSTGVRCALVTCCYSFPCF